MSEILNQELILLNAKSLNSILLDKLILISLAVGSFYVAWYIQGCFNLNFPLNYGGDSFFMSWLIKRLIDGVWIFNNGHSGFPFGSAFYDFPFSDLGSFAIIKLVGVFTHSYILTLNIYYLLSFSVTSLITYIVLQKLNINKIFSITGAMLFTFLPFHLLRLAHIFYTWYFIIPISFWVAFQIFGKYPLFFESKKNGSINIKYFLLIILLACFGAYYAFFSALIFLGSGIVGAIQWKTSKNLISSFIAISIISLGLVINLTPNLIYFYKNGNNPSVAHRNANESEYHGLKLIQMLLPQPLHRLKYFQTTSKKYIETFPLVAENMTASLGLIGSSGLLFLLIINTMSAFFSFKFDERIKLLSFLTMFMFLFATIGGVASIFSMVFTPLIRAWNRISIFIGFTTICASMITMDLFFKRLINNFFFEIGKFFIAFILIVFGILDQTFSTSKLALDDLKKEFLIDRKFVQKIEKAIPNKSVYQLPYVGFPEEVINNNYYSYNPFRGYLHSTTLHWSSGGMKGRPGDLFFRNLANQPMNQQINIIKKLGFNGIYIDRRGYSDQGIAIEKEIAEKLGHKVNIVSDDNNLLFFYVPN